MENEMHPVHEELSFNIDKKTLRELATEMNKRARSEWVKILEDTEDKYSYAINIDYMGMSIHNETTLGFEEVDENNSKLILDISDSQTPTQDINNYKNFFNKKIAKILKKREKEAKKAAKKAAKEAKKNK